jgi:hypothetical protein
MDPKPHACPDCDAAEPKFGRREFLKTVGVTAAATAAGTLPVWATPRAAAAPTAKSPAETAVKGLYDSLTEQQRKTICFAWDHIDKEQGRGLLRTFVSNNWQITKPYILSDFYTRQQQDIIHDIWQGLINPEWYGKFMRQLKDDTGGKLWGSSQSIALFGKPGDDQFEFVMTGRHMTLRADGNTEASVAFGGPIFYGHQASRVSGLLEKDGHPGNVFFHQALMANGVFKLLDPKQQAKALMPKSPHESAVGFQGKGGEFPGIPVKELDDSQKKELQKVLTALIEPFRQEDQDEAMECLKKQGGLDACALSFYKDEDHGKDGVWDNWRLEGPAFVWYFRGNPHVHVWVHVADDPSVKINSAG